MKNSLKIIAVTTLMIFSSYTACAYTTGKDGVIPRSQWGADESLRYVDDNPDNGQTYSGTADADSTEEDKSNDSQVYSKVISKDAKGNVYKWPLQYPDKIQKIVIHHTATKNAPADASAVLRSIYYYHSIVRAWGDIGYNYIVDENGNVYEGRAGGEMVVGAHAKNWNSGTIGISVLGNYQDNKVPEKVINALAKLISKKAKEYGINPKGSSVFHGTNLPNIIGHRDVAATQCPGDYLYEKLPLIREMAAKTYDEKPKFTKDYDYEDQSSLYYVELNPGETKEVTLKFENIGKKAWDSNTFIVVDANSAFDKVVSFPEKQDVILGKMVESNVNSGSTGTFKFKIKGGQRANTVEMSIAILADGKTKLSDYFKLPVTVFQSNLRYKIVDKKMPPAAMQQGETFTGWVKLKNTGNVTWQKSGINVPILAADHERGRNSVFMVPAGQKIGTLQEKEVKPGDVGTFNFTITAPNKDGYYQEYFTPLVDWTNWMPDTGMYFQTLVGASLYDSEVIGQSSNKRWQRGKTYKMWINIRNMGTKTWTSDNMKLTFIKEEDLKVSKATILNDKIPPGQVGRIEFTVMVDPKDDLDKKVMQVRPSVDGTYVTSKPIIFDYTSVITDGEDRASGAIFKKTTPTKATTTKTTPTVKKPTSTTTMTNTTTSSTTKNDSTKAMTSSTTNSSTKTDTTKTSSTILKGNGTEGTIRIKLTFDGNPEIGGNGGFSIVSGSQTLATLTKNDSVIVNKSGTQYQISAANSLYNVSDPVRIVPDTGTILVLKNSTQTYKEYLGVLEVRIVDGKLVVIDELPLEDYLKGVGEEPNNTAIEKIKTIIVAARTYAKYYMDKAEKFPGKPYNLEDSPVTSQKYLGYGFEKLAPNVVKAVDETRGQVVTYKGDLIKTPYFSRSDGTYTKSSKEVWGTDIPYLVPVKDSLCKSTAFAGHGVGLSGCGASAMADQGSKYVEILKYYYTGVDVTDLY